MLFCYTVAISYLKIKSLQYYFPMHISHQNIHIAVWDYGCVVIFKTIKCSYYHGCLSIREILCRLRQNLNLLYINNFGLTPHGHPSVSKLFCLNLETAVILCRGTFGAQMRVNLFAHCKRHIRFLFAFLHLQICPYRLSLFLYLPAAFSFSLMSGI